MYIMALYLDICIIYVFMYLLHDTMCIQYDNYVLRMYTCNVVMNGCLKIGSIHFKPWNSIPLIPWAFSTLDIYVRS